MITSVQDSADAGSERFTLAVSHKFSPPSALATAISRPRLLADIPENRNFAAVVVQGPAGYGKSTLMQQIYDHSTSTDVLTGWLTLDESDNDISRFNTLLSLLIHKTCEKRQAGDLYRPLALGNSAVENLLDVLVDTPEPIAFFIDEFQTISGSINIGLLNTLIERCPAHVTFYIGSRALPSLASGRLLISGRIKLITAEELCFTTKEVSGFLESVDLVVSAREAEALREQTGGWPAVLQLLHLALKGGRVDRNTLSAWIRGAQNELADYLTENVIAEQPASSVDFLVKTSLLPRLSAPLCEAITRDENSEQVLQSLVAQGLFIRVIDQEKKWFKYHSLFATYLKNQFQRTHGKQEEDQIRGIAAEWFYTSKLYEEAVEQSTMASDYPLATKILCEWAPALVCGARLQTIDQLVSPLPDEVCLSEPMLCWSLTWARLFLSQSHSAKSPLEGLQRLAVMDPDNDALNSSARILECTYAYIEDNADDFTRMIQQLEIATSLTVQYRNFEMGALGNLHSIHQLRNRSFTLARENALLAQSLAERGKAAFSGAYAIGLGALSLIETGDLKLATKKLKDGLNNEQLRVQGSFSTAPLSALYGHALYESGKFAEAESHLRDSIDTISKTLPTDFLIFSYLTLARASEFNDRESTDTLEILDDAEKLAFDRQDERLAAAIKREHIRRALADKKLAQARRLRDEPGFKQSVNDSAHSCQITDGCDDVVLCNIRMGIRGDSPGAADVHLKEEIIQAQENGWTRRLIRLKVLSSIASHLGGDHATALTLLRDALEQASIQGYAALFLEEGTDCINLIRELAGQLETVDKPRVRELISTILPDYASTEETFDNRKDPEFSLAEQPTKRELEILALVANGSSNSEIADQLYVSNNTVKYHLKNLYGKLGVNNRIKLITTARRLGMV